MATKTALTRLPIGLCLLIGTLACSVEGPRPQDNPEISRLRHELRIVYEDPSATFLGIWGQAEADLYFVGGSLDGHGGQILRLVDDEFIPDETPEGPLLWWIHGVDSNHIWAVGEQGRILRKRNGVWSDESTELDERLVLWGVWAAAQDDIWAVGGSVRRNGPKGVVLRSDGRGEWTRIEDPLFPDNFNLYKVWGSSRDDVFIVGEGGIVLHYDGAGFERIDTGISDLIFTVHGSGEHILAVGGSDSGQVFERRALDWMEAGPDGIPGLNGVFMRDNGLGLAVGNRGVFLYRDEHGEWKRVRPQIQSVIGARTLHAVWANTNVWSVGGDLSEMKSGMIVTDDPRFRGRSAIE